MVPAAPLVSGASRCCVSAPDSPPNHAAACRSGRCRPCRQKYKAARYSPARTGLLAHPFAQARFQRAMLRRIEGPKGRASCDALMRHHQHRGLLAFHRHDGGRQADGDCFLCASQAHQRKSGGDAFLHQQRRPHAVQRRDHARRRGPAPRRHGAPAAGWAGHGARAGAWPGRSRSSRPGPSRSHRMVKADAMERLMPAQQWIRSGCLASQPREKASSASICWRARAARCRRRDRRCH